MAEISTLQWKKHYFFIIFEYYRILLNLLSWRNSFVMHIQQMSRQLLDALFVLLKFAEFAVIYHIIDGSNINWMNIV